MLKPKVIETHRLKGGEGGRLKLLLNANRYYIPRQLQDEEIPTAIIAIVDRKRMRGRGGERLSLLANPSPQVSLYYVMYSLLMTLDGRRSFVSVVSEAT